MMATPGVLKTIAATGLALAMMIHFSPGVAASEEARAGLQSELDGTLAALSAERQAASRYT